MKLKYRILALVCAVWIAFLPSLAFSQASTVGNDANPTAPGGVRILGTDGVSDRKLLTNSDGRLDMLSGYPGMEVLNHRSNVTIASAAIDSSLIPFSSLGYRQMYALLRVKAATVGATFTFELAVKGAATAQYDSTALGWYYPLGLGSFKKAKCLPIASFFDRWQMVPLADSLSGVPFMAPYTGVYLLNRTGAQAIVDLWILGVR